MRLGLLKTAGLGRLKTADSAYKKPHRLVTHWFKRRNRPPYNYANNKEYFVFFLTRRRVVDNSPSPSKYPAENPPYLLRYTTTPFRDVYQYRAGVDATVAGGRS